MRTGLSPALLLAALVLPAAPAAGEPPPPAPQLVIAFEPGAVVLQGATPQGKVAWLGVAREFDQMSLRLVRRSDISVDDDGDGVIRLEMEDGVPGQSVWAAVDITSGAFATAAAPGFELQPLSLSPSAVRPGALGSSDLFEAEGVQLELLLARPGAGAWGRALGDGGDADFDGRGDGWLQLALDDLRALGNTPALRPAVARPGDVLVAVDPMSLRLYAARLGGPR